MGDVPSIVGAMCDSNTYNAGTRYTTENTLGHDQDMQRFLMVWKDRANGGQRAVAWESVCSPKWD